MFNSQRPDIDDLPTSRQLVKATLLAAAAAGVILITIILPAEHAIDPTGIGRLLGLTEMGEIKAQLAEEAAADAAADLAAATQAAGPAAAEAVAAAGPPAVIAEAPAVAPAVAPATPVAAPVAAPAATVMAAAPAATVAGVRSDVTRITLAPDKAAEVKLVAKAGAAIDFNWSVEGGVVNYDTHGDPDGEPDAPYHGYGKGRDSAGERGRLTAAFDGKHGWYWRNRGDAPVTIVLTTSGAYAEVVRM